MPSLHIALLLLAILQLSCWLTPATGGLQQYVAMFCSWQTFVTCSGNIFCIPNYQSIGLYLSSQGTSGFFFVQ